MTQDPSDLTVRRLTRDDAQPMAALRREALDAAPLAFGSTPEDDRFGSIQAVEDALAPQDHRAVFGLWQGATLQGMVGVHGEQSVKERHKAYVWGMYVRPEARGRGGGTQLLQAVVAWARRRPDVLQVHLSVTDAADAARSLYRKAGFVEWGIEPRALSWQGEFVAERHLVLRLDTNAEE